VAIDIVHCLRLTAYKRLVQKPTIDLVGFLVPLQMLFNVVTLLNHSVSNAQIGPENVIQIITDSAAACKAAGRLVEEQFPHITWTPCTAHCLDLLLEDIGKLPWAKDLLREGKDIVQFVMNHHKSLAIFRQHSTLELLRPGEQHLCTVCPIRSEDVVVMWQARL
jgi:selenocysteine lyase/cysteine desulfurase